MENPPTKLVNKHPNKKQQEQQQPHVIKQQKIRNDECTRDERIFYDLTIVCYLLLFSNACGRCVDGCGKQNNTKVVKNQKMGILLTQLFPRVCVRRSDSGSCRCLLLELPGPTTVAISTEFQTPYSSFTDAEYLVKIAHCYFIVSARLQKCLPCGEQRDKEV